MGQKTFSFCLQEEKCNVDYLYSEIDIVANETLPKGKFAL